MTTETPFHADLRRILGDTEHDIVCAKAAILDRLIERLHGAFVDDVRRFYLSPDAAPKVAHDPTPEAPPDAPSATEPAPAVAPDPTPDPSADELLSPPVRRPRGRPRKVDTAEGQPRQPEPKPEPAQPSDDVSDIFGTEPSADDDFFAPASTTAGADPDQNTEQDDGPDFLDGLD